MAGFQFIHVDSFSLKAAKGKTGGHCVRSIVAEAQRESGACDHVTNPRSPILLYGVPVSELEGLCSEYTATMKDAKGRKMRADGLCLMGGVVSCPPEADSKRWEAIKNDSIDWLVERYGGRLRSVIEHTDEDRPHFHWYLIPLPGERFDAVHEGKREAAAAKAASMAKGDQNKAYKAAMRAWQDSYFDSVGAKNALARIGPGRRRLTRQQWMQEQNAVERVGQAIKQAEELKVTAIDCRELAAKEAESLRIAAANEAKNIANEALIAADLAHAKAEADAKLLITDAGLKATADAATLKAKVSQDAVMDFAQKSLWGKLGVMLTGLAHERDELQKLVKKLTRKAEKNAEALKSREGYIVELKEWAENLRAKMDNVIEERKKAQAMLNRANIDRRELKQEIFIMRERNSSFSKVESELSRARNERDYQRARADQMSGYISKYEAFQKAQGGHELPSVRRSHVEFGHTV